MKKEHAVPSLLILLSAAFGLLISRYGLPYGLHPDESYIIKDPLKNLVNYAHLEFTAPMNLYNWLLAAWYGLVFGLGLLFHQWSSFTDFSYLVILEDGSILFYGRILSVLLVCTAHFFTWKILRDLPGSPRLRWLLFSLFILNPVLASSLYWVKFDAATYLASWIMFYLLFSYFVLEKKELRGRIIFTGILLVSVRVELACFPLAFFLFESRKSNRGSERFFNAAFFRAFAGGTAAFLLLTLYPLFLLYNFSHHAPAEMPLTSTKTFEKAIGSGITHQFLSGAFFENVASNFFFYALLSLVAFGALGPASLLLLFPRFKNNVPPGAKRMAGFSFLYIFLFLLVLLLFPYHATHYFVSISSALLLLTCLGATYLKGAVFQKALPSLHLLWMGTLLLAFLLSLQQKDTRLEAKDFILANSTASDTLAIETISVNGYHPLVGEFPDVLRKKSAAVKKAGNGTGSYYELLSRQDSSGCRHILDVFTENYFPGDPESHAWINTYDTISFHEAHASWFITTYDITSRSPNSQVGSFYRYVQRHYHPGKTFRLSSFDPRLASLIGTEPYFKNVYFYKRAN